MNPENRGQETTRRSKLQIRRKASTDEGSLTNVYAHGPVYAPVPLRTAWTVDLGDGRHGTMVHSNIDNSFTFLQPEARLAVPAAPSPWTTNPSMPLFAAAPAPQDEHEGQGLFLLLIKVLYACAAALDDGETELVNNGLQWISSHASDSDEEPIQRLASSFADALALRMVQPWQRRITTPAQEAAARRHFGVMCPFLRISGAVANHAIVDAVAVQPERIVHVVDLGGADPGQWLQFLRLFAERSAYQLLRLTIVNEQEEFLSDAAKLLATEAERLRVGFLFHPVRLHIDQLFSVDALDVRSGEALFVVSTLQLHRLLADKFADVPSPPHDRKGKKVQAHGAQQHRMTGMTRADALLRDLRKLSLKLVVLTEQEADHNGADFAGRFRKALDYYGALFDALEDSACAGRGSAEERASVERCLLREEIRDIVAYDGPLRRERHETVERWAVRMDAAGFAPAAIGQGTVAQAVKLAQELLPGGGTAYVVSRVIDGCFFICRHGIPMFSVSTWRAAV